MVGARLANLKRGDNQFTKEHPSIEGTSQADAAEQMQVGVASIERAAAATAAVVGVSPVPSMG